MMTAPPLGFDDRAAALSSADATHPRGQRTTTMGFLDDLKRQAEAAKAQRQAAGASTDRHVLLTEAAMKAASEYLYTFAQQLNVLTPISPLRFELDGRTTIEGLRLCEFRSDARHTQRYGREVFEYIAMAWRLRGGPALKMAKNFTADIERLEARLAAGGVECVPEPVRNGETGKLVEVRYQFTADFRGSVRIVPEHERGQLQFTVTGCEAFETVVASFPATEISTARLDELGRWIVGERSEFLKGASALRRQTA
jgi:hypothetical protein